MCRWRRRLCASLLVPLFGLTSDGGLLLTFFGLVLLIIFLLETFSLLLLSFLSLFFFPFFLSFFLFSSSRHHCGSRASRLQCQPVSFGYIKSMTCYLTLFGVPEREILLVLLLLSLMYVFVEIYSNIAHVIRRTMVKVVRERETGYTNSLFLLFISEILLPVRKGSL